MVEFFWSSLMVKLLVEFKAKYGLPDEVVHIHANDDEVYTHYPGYCTIFAYPFTIGYAFPLPPLVDEFCHFYRDSTKISSKPFL